jgi:tripartite-type tricarboxylate transporter receptor subunit TctC
MKKAFAIASAAMLSVFAASSVHADYPERPINMIVAFSAGGGTDIAARTIAPFIEDHLDGSIQVMNRAGAGGEVGFTALATARPDGYTIGFINVPTLLTIPIQREANYTLDDIQPIGRIVYDAGAFSVREDSDFETLEDLVAHAKEHPNTITYGTTGIGTDNHLAALQFERQAGIELRHVPFSGAADLRAATLGGHIAIGTMNISEAVDDLEAGSIRVLGQMSDERWEAASEVPTFKEQGYELVMGSHRGIAAPAGLPEDVLEKLSAAVENALADPEFQEKAKQQNLPLAFIGPEEFQAELERLNADMQELWDEQPWSD